MQQLISDCKGSPPYTWGALKLFRIKESTHVDHPHIHGEHTHTVSALVIIRGSPPYTWGAPAPVKENKSVHGITPIYMGSTVKDPCNQAVFKFSKTLFQSVWS